MEYNVTLRFSVELDTDDVSAVEDLVNEVAPDYLLVMASSSVDVEVSNK